MNALTRREGAAYPEEPAPWVDPEYWQQKQATERLRQEQYYLELPAGQGKWRTAQLHAGVCSAPATAEGWAVLL